MKRKVYISSTLDMPQYRNAVIDVLNLNNDFYEFTKIAEYMSTSSIDTLTICLGEVRNCDLYILIIGLRYGSLPDGRDKSYTHIEYLTAVEEKKEILVLYATDDNPDLPKEPVYKQQFIDFKNIATSGKDRYVREGFNTVEKLKNQLYQIFYARVLENLPMILDDDITYKCDRKEPKTTYEGHLLFLPSEKKTINSFLYGSIYDRPVECYKSIAKYVCNNLPSYIMNMNEITPCSNDESRWPFFTFFKIYKLMHPETGNSPTDEKVRAIIQSTQNFVHYMQSEKINEFSLILKVEYSKFANDTDKKKITNYVQNLVQSFECVQSGDMLIHICIAVVGKDDYEIVMGEYSCIFDMFNQDDVLDMKGLKKISRQDIKDWIEEVLKQKNPINLDKLTDEYFGTGDFKLCLSDALLRIENMIKKTPYYK